MSEFKNINFVNEFAYRTKLNYYYQKERFAKGKDKEKAQKDVQRTIANMERQGFNIAPYYEVTDLINSMIGLLVFPEQDVFKKIPSRERDLESKFPKLYNCVKNDVDYYNTYETWYKNSPRDIIKHLRNSISHYNMMIEPQSGMIGGKSQIIAIRFKDEGTYNIEEKTCKGKFCLNIKVDCLEDVVMEICDYLINVNG